VPGERLEVAGRRGVARANDGTAVITTLSRAFSHGANRVPVRRATTRTAIAILSNETAARPLVPVSIPVTSQGVRSRHAQCCSTTQGRNKGSSGNRVGDFAAFQSAVSMQVRILSRRYSSSRKPYARRWMTRAANLRDEMPVSTTQPQFLLLVIAAWLQPAAVKRQGQRLEALCTLSTTFAARFLAMASGRCVLPRSTRDAASYLLRSVLKRTAGRSHARTHMPGRAAQGFTHAGFDCRRIATPVHRELFEQTVRLPRREP
jgi:hypothetical protein